MVAHPGAERSPDPKQKSGMTLTSRAWRVRAMSEIRLQTPATIIFMHQYRSGWQADASLLLPTWMSPVSKRSLWRTLAAGVMIVVAAGTVACSRNPDTARRKFVESGDR